MIEPVEVEGKPDLTTDIHHSAATTEAPPPDPTPSPTSLKRVVLPVLLSLTVLGVIGFFTFEPAEFREIIERPSIWWILAALAMLGTRIYLGGERLNYVSRGRLGLAGGMRGQLAWEFFSNVTPSAIGGGPFAAIYIARNKRIDVGETTAFMLFLILLDQLWFAMTIPAILLASFHFDVIPSSLGDVGTVSFLTFFLSIIAWVGLFGYATFFRPLYLHRIASWIIRLRWLHRFEERVEHTMKQLRYRARILRSQPVRFHVKGFLLTFGLWLSRYLLLMCIVWSFVDVSDSFLTLFRTVAIMLGSLILPTPGGAGGIEGLYALFMGPLIPSTLLVPTLLVWRFLGFYLFIGLGGLLAGHPTKRGKPHDRPSLPLHVIGEPGHPTER